MTYIILTIAIVLFALGMLISYFNRDSIKSWPDHIALGSFFISLLLFGMFISLILYDIETTENNEPTALDVYRGKTTLQITYQDSIPVDSVVVFKEKVKYNV